MRYMFLLIALFAIIGIVGAAELKNTVTATAVDGTGANVTNSSEATIAINETVSAILMKDVEKKVYKPGEMANYTFRLSNTGTAKLTDVRVVDDLLGTIAMSATIVGPGEFSEGSAQLKVTEDMLPGPVISYAVASMMSLGKPTTRVASAVFEIVAEPDILVTKLTDVSSADIGNEVVYIFTIENTGSRTLYNVTAVDDKLGDLTLPKTTLAPGENITVTKNHAVTVEDIEG
ncbi:MAG: hypothetical protein WC261_11720 [Synergistaceae bacterium]|jgi:uncharacterized repeat protein (TIGR01451 family)